MEDCDEHGRAWHQLIVKVKSVGPSIGNMSKTSLKFFFMSCYDMALLLSGDRMIHQIMYGE